MWWRLWSKSDVSDIYKTRNDGYRVGVGLGVGPRDPHLITGVEGTGLIKTNRVSDEGQRRQTQALIAVKYY